MVCAAAVKSERTRNMPKKGKPIRPIISPGISGKKFQPLVQGRRIQSPPAHPLVVIGDLRAGSLRSLDAYLKRHRGIPDSQVALELRKLLSGSPARTKFRLVVVDHPKAPKSKGGRPKRSKAPNRKEQELVGQFRARVEFLEGRGGRKRGIARELVAEEKGHSIDKVKRVIRRVEAWEARQNELNPRFEREKRAAHELLSRRELALRRLKRETR